MSSITLKISSLLIRTLSKPIASRIKAQAREHETFRRICISFAQSLHRLDMRLRLGLLQDHAAIDRQIAREAAEAQAHAQANAAKKLKSETPTVPTEAEAKSPSSSSPSSKDPHRDNRETSRNVSAADKHKPTKPRIRPLSEAKAIDSGANFISETFLFTVGLSLIVFEAFRSRRKEASRRTDVAEKLGELEERDRRQGEWIVRLEREIGELRGKEDVDVDGGVPRVGKAKAKGAERQGASEEKGQLTTATTMLRP